MRTPWRFGSYVWPVNPEEDDGFKAESKLALKDPLSGNVTSVQFMGLQSATRSVRGWFFGPESTTHRDQVYAWQKAGTVAILEDHTGFKVRCMISSFSYKEVKDYKRNKDGIYTYKYEITFLAREEI